MPASKKKTQRRPALDKRTLNQQKDYRIPKGFWFRLALALLAIYSLYIIIGRAANTGNLPISLNPVALLDPSGTSLFIVIFSILYFYTVWKKIILTTLTKVSGYAIVTITIVAIALSFFFENQSHSSSDDFYFLFTVLFHNSFISGLMSLIAILGSTSLFVHIVRAKR